MTQVNSESGIYLDSRKHVVIPNDRGMKLEDMPPRVSLRLQEDALDALEPLCGYLALRWSVEGDQEAHVHLNAVIDVLVRGGRL